MLILAGLGISDEEGLTLEEIKEAKDSDYVFLESYTSIWLGSAENLEKAIGKKVEILRRSDLEENVDKIIQLAKTKKVIIFVPGDPLAATTHSSIILECKKRGINFKIIHNSSIFSAIFETGLHPYKFGQPFTIPLKEKVKGNLDSIINGIKENKKRGLHTLCLLDIDVENNKFLEVRDAIKFLLENDIIEDNEKIVVASCIGSKYQKIIWEEAGKIVNMNLRLPAVVIVTGVLHFSEKEMLENF
jgi:diphthine synthase